MRRLAWFLLLGLGGCVVEPGDIERGLPGVACWDLDGDGVGDDGEDANGDGVFDALDCAGPDGQTGPKGTPGEDGDDGTDGLPGKDGMDGLPGKDGAAGTSAWTDGPASVTTEVDVGIGTGAPAACLDVQGTLSRPLTGTVSVTQGDTSKLATGMSTKFTSELSAGDAIKIGIDVFNVTAILDDTHLTLDTVPPNTATATAFADPSVLFRVANGAGFPSLTIERGGPVFGGNGVIAVSNAPRQASFPKTDGSEDGSTTPTKAVWGSPMIYNSPRYPNDGTGPFPFNQYGELILQGTSHGIAYNRGISLVTWDGTGDPAIRVRVAANGRVGIGTTTPEGPLHVAAPDARLVLEDTTGSPSKWSIYAGESTDGRLEIRDTTYSNNSSTTRIAVEPSGNVGIGATGANERLVVNGNLVLRRNGNAQPGCAVNNDRGKMWVCDSSVGACPNLGCPSHTGNYNDHLYVCLRVDNNVLAWSCIK